MATAKPKQRQRPRMNLEGPTDALKPVGATETAVTSAQPEVRPELPAVQEKDEKKVQASRVGKRAVTFYVSPDAFRQLRILSAQTDQTIQELMQEALDWQFQQHNMHRLAKQ